MSLDDVSDVELLRQAARYAGPEKSPDFSTDTAKGVDYDRGWYKQANHNVQVWNRFGQPLTNGPIRSSRNAWERS